MHENTGNGDYGVFRCSKTTLVRNILENAKGKKIALIINEFGDLGIDRSMLEGCGIEGCEEDNMVELANGCICCTVADDFLPTMEALIDRDEAPDHIVIETSGLALPKPLIKAFNWPEIKSRVTVMGYLPSSMHRPLPPAVSPIMWTQSRSSVKRMKI